MSRFTRGRCGWRTITGGTLTASILACVVAGAAIAQEAIDESGYAYIAPLADRTLLIDATTHNGRTVAVGDRGIVLVSTDGAASWTQSRVPTRSMLTGVFFYDDQLGWAVGHDALVLKTEDGGVSWRRVNFAPELELPLFDVWFADADHGLAVGAYGFVLDTSDGGETWNERTLDAADFGATTAEAEAGSADGGDEEDASWEEEPPQDYHLNNIAAGADGRLYIAAEAGHVFRSDDAGQTWIRMPSDYDGSFFGGTVLSNGDVLMYGLQGTMYRSSDGGETWREIDTGVSTTLIDGAELDDGTVVVVGVSGTVLVSRDHGESFELVQREDRKALTSVLEANEGGLLLFGEAGTVRMAAGTY
jgi:photosystem II stability/assembly factor-like uncharacterized protein